MKNNLILEEFNLKDDSYIWNEFIKNSINPNMYQYGEFINIHAYKCLDVKNLIFKKKESVYAIISLGIFDTHIAKSPFSASFGGFNYRKNIKLGLLNEIVEGCIEYCNSNGLKKIEICQPPLIYYDDTDERIDYALLNNNFTLNEYDVSLYKSRYMWKEDLKNSLKRNVKKAISNDLEFKKIDDVKECFEFIRNQKELAKVPFSINYLDFELLSKHCPQNIYLFGVYKDKTLISSIILYSINKKTILGFNWAQDTNYQHLRPSDFMLYKSMEWAFERNYEFFDFGTTTLNGKINEGVTDFKEKFNPLSALRKKYIYNL